MAEQHISRDLFFGTGGRPYNNKDFVELQNRIRNNQKAFDQFVLSNVDGTQSSFVLEGCDSAGETGLVYLNGEVRYVPEDANIISTQPSVAYIETLSDENENRIYADETEQTAFTLHQAKWVTTTTSGQENIRFAGTSDYTNNKLKNKGFVRSIIGSGNDYLTDAGLRGDVTIEGDGQAGGGNDTNKITVTLDDNANKVIINTPLSTAGDISYGGSGNPDNKITKFTNSSTIADTNMTHSGSDFTVIDGNFNVFSSNVKEMRVGISDTQYISMKYSNNTTILTSRNDNSRATFYVQLGASTSIGTGLTVNTDLDVIAGRYLLASGNSIGFNKAGIGGISTLITYLGAGDSNGGDVRIQSGRLLMVGAGESASTLYGIVNEVSADENLYLSADSNIYFYSNVQTSADRRKATYNTNGTLEMARNTSGTYIGLDVVNTDNSGVAEIRARGNGSGDGRVSVGQSTSYGGGIEYEGTSDYCSLFRNDNGSRNWVARWLYNSNNFYTSGSVYPGANIYMGADSSKIYWNSTTDTVAYIAGATNGSEIDIASDNLIKFIESDNGGTAMEFSCNNGTGTATDWIATSDKRLKTNIEPLPSQLDKVAEVGKLAVSYIRTDSSEKESKIGFIAQDLQPHYPEFIYEDNSDEKMLGISYAKMVAPLYKAISELKDIVDKQQNEIDNLKRQL